MKLHIGKFLEELEEQLSARFRQYNDLQHAIETQKMNLEEIHQITVEADSLTALVQCQKKMKLEFEEKTELQREDFEEEIAETRKQWEMEKNNYSNSCRNKLIRSKEHLLEVTLEASLKLTHHPSKGK